MSQTRPLKLIGNMVRFQESVRRFAMTDMRAQKLNGSIRARGAFIGIQKHLFPG